MQRLRVAIVGPSAATEEEVSIAKTIGEALAARGVVVVTGGLGGVMEAACQGAAMADGVTVGFLPGNDVATANPWVTVPLPTGFGEARNALVASTADALVAVGGSWGTLSELALACRQQIPTACVNGWIVWDGFESKAPGVSYLTSADEAIAWLDSALAL